MRNMLRRKALGAIALLGAGMFLVAGCKSAPELTQDQAQAMIQAKYDQTPPAGINITVNKLGMNMGITDGYWKLTKVYPNRFWADYTLTDEGKKAVKLPAGGDTIQWRPDSAGDQNFTVVIQTAAANHLKARDVHTPASEVLPGSETSMGAQFTEAVDLTGVPQPLQDIAHNPGNQLSTKRQADFVLDGGAWKLRAIN